MFCNGWSIPLLLLLATSLPSQTPTPVTPEELLENALINNRDIAAIRHRIAEAKGLLRQAGVRPAPTLEASGASGQPLRTQGEESYSASLSQQFETFGKRQKRVRIAEYGVGLAEAELAERIATLKRDINFAFAEASADQQKFRVLRGLAQVLRDGLRLTEARVNEGDAARLEADLTRVELSRIEAQQAAAAGEVEADLLELRRLAGMEPDNPITLPDTPEPASSFDPEILRHAAFTQRPDLLAARLIERQAAAGVELAEAEAKPDVTLSAGYSHETGRFDDQLGLSPSGVPVQLRDVDNILSVGISIPLTGRRRNLGNIEAAGARSASARLRREFLERSMPAEIEAAVRRYEALRRSVALTRDGVLNQSQKNLEIIRQAYGLGQLRLLDVLNEQRRLLETRLAYIDAVAELRRALAELERAVGGELP
jgi:cobalt-zinc-cadmium efflux system outer membrane protein